MFSDVGEYCAETPEKYQDGKRKCYNVTKNVLDNSEKLLQGGELLLLYHDWVSFLSSLEVDN